MPATPDKVRDELLRDLLKQVSRSFYLSLKWLPPEVRDPICLAYLLARTSDTIADTARIPADQRLTSLERFAGRVSGTDSNPLDLQSLREGQDNEAEGILLNRVEDSLALLEQAGSSDQELIRQVLATILSGQTLDLRRFAGASPSNLAALETSNDLEDYTYRVAGCVGEFWTRICFANLQPHCSVPEQSMVGLGVSYGRGLQLINILRDLPRDLRHGRCYLPSNQLQAANLTPTELLDPQTESKLRPIYDEWLKKAQQHLADGWTYTNAYPRTAARIRISCALPILIGWKTIDRLKTGRILDPATRIKVSRGEVKRLVLKTLLSHPFDSAWQRLAHNQL